MCKGIGVFLLLLICLLSSASLAPAAVTLVTTRSTASDAVNWQQLGEAWTTVPYAFLATSKFGDPTLGHFVRPGTTGEIRQQGHLGGWTGNFAPGDYLLWTRNAGPLTIVFDRGYGLVGAQIQWAVWGNFTAQLSAYNGTRLLGTVTENGYSSRGGDNSAIFIGISTGSTVATQLITKVVFSLTDCSSSCGDFAINALSLAYQSTTTVVSSSLNPSYFGQAVTFTAKVTPSTGSIPDGESVTFMDDTYTVPITLGTGWTSGGVATYSTTGLEIGNHYIRARYSGDSGYIASTSKRFLQKVQ
jgi:Bacterial Ig-like domain (group 3)